MPSTRTIPTVKLTSVTSRPASSLARIEQAFARPEITAAIGKLAKSLPVLAAFAAAVASPRRRDQSAVSPSPAAIDAAARTQVSFVACRRPNEAPAATAQPAYSDNQPIIITGQAISVNGGFGRS